MLTLRQNTRGRQLILFDSVLKNTEKNIFTSQFGSQFHLTHLPLITSLYNTYGDEGNRTPDLPDANGTLSQAELRPHNAIIINTRFAKAR